jgi:hypothetical protein
MADGPTPGGRARRAWGGPLGTRSCFLSGGRGFPRFSIDRSATVCRSWIPRARPERREPRDGPGLGPAATSGDHDQEVKMFTLAPSLFFAILFGWTPWPYNRTHPTHREEEGRPAARRKA